MKNKTTALQEIKAAGLGGLGALSKVSGQSDQTLRNWHTHRNWVFNAVIEKAIREKFESEADAKLFDAGLEGLHKLASVAGIDQKAIVKLCMSWPWLMDAIVNQAVVDKSEAEEMMLEGESAGK